jgi:hypothetical protein
VFDRPRWPTAVFILAMVVGTLAIAFFVYILWGVGHLD